jgi:cytochrome d ubiquinol oxidase subunit II
MGVDISLIWAAIIFFGVMMYVITDGFDLGIGLLFAFISPRAERDVMMNTVAPVWDGNETWLVLGGAGMLAAFPTAYSILLSALYLPLIFMLLGLIFRGVAFEFRFKANDRERPVWDAAFIGGSLVASFFQGVSLGAYIDGVRVSGYAFAGGPLDWLRPFPVFCGIGVLAAYALLGATWLVMKTGGKLQQAMIHLAGRLVWTLLAAIVVVSIWTPFSQPHIAQRWFTLPNLLWFCPVPLLVALCVYALRRSLRHEPDMGPFLYALALVFLGYSGLAISIWPNIVPPGISIWDAAGPLQSQLFTLVGALFIIPFILVYTTWSYYVFRGKVRQGEHYH